MPNTHVAQHDRVKERRGRAPSRTNQLSRNLLLRVYVLCYALRSAVAWPSLAYRYNRYAIIHMIDKAEAAVGWKSIELRSSSPSSPSPTFSYSIFVPARSKGLLSSNATTEKTIPNNFSLFSFSLSALVVASRTDMFVRMNFGIQWALVYIIPIRKSVC